MGEWNGGLGVDRFQQFAEPRKRLGHLLIYNIRRYNDRSVACRIRGA